MAEEALFCQLFGSQVKRPGWAGGGARGKAELSRSRSVPDLVGRGRG